VAGALDERASFEGQTILAVFAHPDDESLACGGTIARLADAGATVVLVCASRGERGFVSDPALVPDGDLGRARAHELHAAAKILGVAEVIAFNHPDGNLRWAEVRELHTEIVSTIDRYSPDAVITFDEDGLYWHLDHIGIHERTMTAVLAFGSQAPPLYYVTMPRGAMRRVVDAAITKGWTQPPKGFWALVPDAFGLQAETPTFTLDIAEWVPRKLAALRCHLTQLGSTNPFSLIDENDARKWLGMEFFRRAETSGPTEPVLERLAVPLMGA